MVDRLSAKRPWCHLIWALASIVGLLCLPNPAGAYAGPGAGITMIGALIAALAAIILTVVGLFMWPAKMLIRWLKRKDAPDDTTPGPDNGDEPPRDDQ
jgi:hypothetical protein